MRFSFQGNTSLVDWRQSNEERLAAFHTCAEPGLPLPLVKHWMCIHCANQDTLQRGWAPRAWQARQLTLSLAPLCRHWGGPAFFVPPGCPSLQAGSSSSYSLGRTASEGVGGRSTPAAGRPAAGLAAAARPDTARGPRPSLGRQASRLSISSSASADAATSSAAGGLAGTPTSALAGRHSMRSGAGTPTGPLASSRSSLGSVQKQGDLPGGTSSVDGYEADSGAITARHIRPAVAGLSQLSMEGLIAEVRRSCPYAWGASLRVRLSIRLLGGR